MSFRDACKLQPNNRDACETAKRLALKLNAEILPRARAACDAKDVSRCLAELAILVDIAPGPDVNAVLDQAGQVHAEHCLSTRMRTAAEAVHRARCFEALRDRVSTPAYMQRVAEDRRSAAAFIESLAAAERQQPANNAALLDLAECVSSTPALSAQRRAAQQHFENATRWNLGAELRGLSAPQVCDAVFRASNGRAQCQLMPEALDQEASQRRQTCSPLDTAAGRACWLQTEWLRGVDLHQANLSLVTQELNARTDLGRYPQLACSNAKP